MSSDNITFKNSTKLPEDTKYHASIVADEDYLAGRLNQTDGTLKKDELIYATNSTYYRVTILNESYDHQHIDIYKLDKYGKILNKYENQRTVVLPVGSYYRAEVVADFGYDSTPLLNYNSLKRNRLFTSRKFETKEDAKPETCTIIMTKTKRQIMELHTPKGIFYSSKEKDVSVSLKYDMWYSYTIIPDEGYNPTLISGTTMRTNYRVNKENPLFNKSNMSITLTTDIAKIKRFNIEIKQTANQTLEISGHITNFLCNYGDKLKYNITAINNNYTPGRVYARNKSTNKFVDPYKPVTSDMIIGVTSAHKILLGDLEVNVSGSIRKLGTVYDDDYYLANSGKKYLAFRIKSNKNKLEVHYLDPIDTEFSYDETKELLETYFNNVIKESE